MKDHFKHFLYKKYRDLHAEAPAACISSADYRRRLTHEKTEHMHMHMPIAIIMPR